MKRSFRIGEEQVECLDSINMANVLMLLSRSGQEIDVVTTTTAAAAAHRPTSPARVFECKTCNRQFPSFQALGGHRASHKKPRVADGAGHAQVELAKPRVHECSICGLEFAIGQALGGHMRRHRAALTEGLSAAHGHGLGELTKKHVDDKRAAWLDLDLNMPPEKEEAAAAAAGECRHKIFGFELVDKTPMVDWLH